MVQTVKEILLSQGQVALVDDEDYEWLNQWKWFAHHEKKSKKLIFYARSNQRAKKGVKTLLMHRVIMNPKKGEVVDHIDGNPLNNQKNNLRIVTHRQNCQNKQFKTTSKYPGVYWDKSGNKWRAAISINNKPKYLGLFKTELEAFTAYEKAVNNLAGERVVCRL